MSRGALGRCFARILPRLLLLRWWRHDQSPPLRRRPENPRVMHQVAARRRRRGGTTAGGRRAGAWLGHPTPARNGADLPADGVLTEHGSTWLPLSGFGRGRAELGTEVERFRHDRAGVSTLRSSWGMAPQTPSLATWLSGGRWRTPTSPPRPTGTPSADAQPRRLPRAGP